MRRNRPFRALAVAWGALLAAGCGAPASSEEPAVHAVPGSAASVELPGDWDVVSSTSPAEEIERFGRTHPRFLEIADILTSPSPGTRLAAAVGDGDVRLLVSVNPVGPGYTLAGHISENLPALEQDRPGVGIEIQGPGDELVDLGGVDAWRVRWSYDGDFGKVGLVQYTVVHDRTLYLFTYSTLRPWADSAEVFDTSARSIRFDAASRTARSSTRGLIAFHREGEGERSDIYVVPAEGGDERRLTRSGADSFPAWSPDGKRVAFVSTRDGNPEIYVMRADGTHQQRLTRRPQEDGFPTWSSDGERILFTSGSSDPERYDLYTMGSDGGSIERITHDGESVDGSWSPDGARIAFWSGRDFVSGVYVMNADGSGRRHVTPDFDAAWGPDWSPDGQTILFVSTSQDDEEVPGIYRVDADGSDIRRIAAATGFWIDEPEWSPDGESIAFFSDTGGPGAVWVMDADGSHQRVLTPRGDSHAPSWHAP